MQGYVPLMCDDGHHVTPGKIYWFRPGGLFRDDQDHNRHYWLNVQHTQCITIGESYEDLPDADIIVDQLAHLGTGVN